MQRAAEIAVSFSHTRPNGTSCFTAYSEFVYVSSTRGENIAKGQATAERAFTAWLEADKDYSGQGHRRLMLSEKANAIGIAHVYYNGYHYWVMEVAKTTNKSTKTEALNGAKTVTINGISSTTGTGKEAGIVCLSKAKIKNLSSGQTYYVRARAYATVNGATCYSAWSAKKSVSLTDNE